MRRHHHGSDSNDQARNDTDQRYGSSSSGYGQGSHFSGGDQDRFLSHDDHRHHDNHGADGQQRQMRYGEGTSGLYGQQQYGRGHLDDSRMSSSSGQGYQYGRDRDQQYGGQRDGGQQYGGRQSSQQYGGQYGQEHGQRAMGNNMGGQRLGQNDRSTYGSYNTHFNDDRSFGPQSSYGSSRDTRFMGQDGGGDFGSSSAGGRSVSDDRGYGAPSMQGSSWGREQSSGGRDQQSYGARDQQSDGGRDQQSYGGRDQQRYGGRDQQRYSGENRGGYGSHRGLDDNRTSGQHDSRQQSYGSRYYSDDNDGRFLTSNEEGSGNSDTAGYQRSFGGQSQSRGMGRDDDTSRFGGRDDSDRQRSRSSDDERGVWRGGRDLEDSNRRLRQDIH